MKFNFIRKLFDRRIKLKWICEYSKTEESDRFGRWGRTGIAGRKSILKKGKVAVFDVAYIGKVEDKFYVRDAYHVSGTTICNTVDEAKKLAEDNFNWYIKCVKNSNLV
jgi:hypothetical protein